LSASTCAANVRASLLKAGGLGAVLLRDIVDVGEPSSEGYRCVVIVVLRTPTGGA